MSRAHTGVLLACTMAAIGCGGAGPSGSGPAPAPAPVETATVAPVPVAPTPAEVSAQVRTARSACSTEAAKQQLELVDFVTFNRLDENNWDSTIRVRRRGRLVRVGCRYDLKAAVPYMYEPSAADGGNPWGAAGPPKGAGPGQVAATEPKADPKAAPPKPEPASKSEATKAEPAKAEPPKARPAPPVPGSNINLDAIADPVARAAIVRTRDACLAEAARRRIAFDDFDAFRRVDAARWEAMLLIKKGKGSSRSCQVDQNTGKATIK